MSEPAEIAKMLTKAQRGAVERCASNGNELIRGGMDDDRISLIVLDNLRIKGVLTVNVGGCDLSLGIRAYRLTPLGLAVRRHLLENGNG